MKHLGAMRPAMFVLSSAFAVASAGLLVLPMTGAASPAMAANPRTSPAPGEARPGKPAKPSATPRSKAHPTTATVSASGSTATPGAAAGRGSALNQSLQSSATAESGASDAPDDMAVTGPIDGDAPGSGSDPLGATSGPPGGGDPTSLRGTVRGTGANGGGEEPGGAAASAGSDGRELAPADDDGGGRTPALSARPDGTGLLDPGGPVVSAVSRVPSVGLFTAALLAASTGGLWAAFSFHRRRRPGTVVAAAQDDVPPPFTTLSGAGANRASSADPLVASFYRPVEDGAEGIEAETGPERDRTLPRRQPAWLERLDAARDEAADS
jgi:hypothetical protein